MSDLIRLFGGLLNPVRHPSLAIWLDAMDQASISKSANRVSQWNDKSGKANHVSQTTGSLQPLYVTNGINNKATVQFYDDSTPKLLSRADNTTLDYTEFTMFVVCQRVQILAGPERIAGKFSVSTPANQREMSFAFVSTNYFQCATSSAGTVADGVGFVNSTIGTSTPAILDGRVSQPYGSATAVRSRRNNDAASQSNGSIPGLYNGTSPFHIGAMDGSAQPFAGHIGEVLFYTSCLDDSRRAKILKYLSNKWNIALS
jgi:hypothetical protein